MLVKLGKWEENKKEWVLDKEFVVEKVSYFEFQKDTRFTLSLSLPLSLCRFCFLLEEFPLFVDWD